MHGERWILSSVGGSLYLLGVLLHPTHSSHCYIDTILMNVKILCISSYNALPGKHFQTPTAYKIDVQALWLRIQESQ